MKELEALLQAIETQRSDLPTLLGLDRPQLETELANYLRQLEPGAPGLFQRDHGLPVIFRSRVRQFAGLAARCA